MHPAAGIASANSEVVVSWVSGIRPDRDDVWSRGYICPKGAALGDLHHDPDRRRVPSIRDGERWREASRENAFAEVERRPRPVIHDHGMAAVAAYTAG